MNNINSCENCKHLREELAKTKQLLFQATEEQLFAAFEKENDVILEKMKEVRFKELINANYKLLSIIRTMILNNFTLEHTPAKMFVEALSENSKMSMMQKAYYSEDAANEFSNMIMDILQECNKNEGVIRRFGE